MLGLLLELIKGEALGNMLVKIEGCLLGDVEGEVKRCLLGLLLGLLEGCTLVLVGDSVTSFMVGALVTCFVGDRVTFGMQ